MTRPGHHVHRRARRAARRAAPRRSDRTEPANTGSGHPRNLSPRFGAPMAAALAELGQEWLLPGLGEVPANTALALRTNSSFVHAYMIGLNHELGRELLWREFPTTLTATFFQRFFDNAIDPAAPVDLDPLADWADRPLERHVGRPASASCCCCAPSCCAGSRTRWSPPCAAGETILPLFTRRAGPRRALLRLRHPGERGRAVVDRDRGAAGCPALRLRGRRRPGRRQPRAGRRTPRPPRSPTGCASCRRGSPSRCPSCCAPMTRRSTGDRRRRSRPADRRRARPAAADPALSATLAASHPVVLLPVRVETRYADLAAGGRELLVRIWPDQVHVDAHDPRLTAAEAEAGRQFWLAEWRCGDDQERRRRAWQSLAERFDPARAGWIARATRPENATARPAEAVADTEPPRVLPTFGTVQLTERHVPTRRPPAARGLDGDGVRGWAGGGGRDRPADHRRPGGRARRRRAAGAPGLDGDDDDEVAAVDTAMHWLVDFDTAEDIGMALRLPVAGPVDLLLVTGVREGGPERRRRGARRPPRRATLHRRARHPRAGNAHQQHRRCAGRMVQRRRSDRWARSTARPPATDSMSLSRALGPGGHATCWACRGPTRTATTRSSPPSAAPCGRRRGATG